MSKCIDESCLSAKRAFHLVRARGLNKSVAHHCKGSCKRSQCHNVTMPIVNVDLPSELSNAFCQNIDESYLSAKRAFHIVRTRGLTKLVFLTVVRGLVSIRVTNIGFLPWFGQL